MGAGKLELPRRWEFFHEHMTALRIERVLPIEARHVFGLFDLPNLHRDPFDRLLVSQCRVDGIPLVASDRLLKRYDIEVLW